MSEFSPFMPTGHAFPPVLPQRDHGLRLRLFPHDAPQWSDAMIVRTRRHVGGLVTGMEVALRLVMADPMCADMLDSLPAGAGWRAVSRKDDLLSEPLLRHIAARAGLSLMLRPDQAPQDAPDFADFDRERAGLALGFARWTSEGPDEAPMRVDLPLALATDLMWTVAAVLCRSCEAQGGMAPGTLLALFDMAARGWLDRYDADAVSPLALADGLCATVPQDICADVAARMARCGDYPMMIALMARAGGVASSAVLDTIVHHRDVREVQALCRAAGLDDASFATLLHAMRPLRFDAPSDEAIAALVAEYPAMADDAARDAMARTGVTPAFHATFEHVHMLLPEPVVPAPVASVQDIADMTHDRSAAPASPKVFVPDFGKRLDLALRQPIGRIIANAETISGQLEGPLQHDYAGYAADIANAGRHLMELVDDLADLQAIDRPNFAVAREEIDLADIARRTAGLLGLKARDRNIRIDTPPVGEQMRAMGEFRRALQIAVNLVGNAIRYGPEDSVIWLRVDDEGGMARLIVADQGRGIAPEDQERVFEKFERLGRQDAAGSGLGLYISRRLARAMGGDITLDSAPGQGARFILSLPVA